MRLLLLIVFAAGSVLAWPLKKSRPEEAAAAKLDKYVKDVTLRDQQTSTASAGSMYSTPSRLGDAFRDVRAGQLNDLVTIVVTENTSAVSTGVTNTSRKSSVTSGVSSLVGQLKLRGRLRILPLRRAIKNCRGKGRLPAVPP